MMRKIAGAVGLILLLGACSVRRVRPDLSQENDSLRSLPLSEDPIEAISEWLSAGSFLAGDAENAPAADLATVRYPRRKAIDGYECHAIEWHDKSGGYWSGVFGVIERSTGQWDVDGGGWGAGPSPDFGLDVPVAFLAGIRGDHFCLGSWAYDPTGDVAFARLVSDDTVLAEDTVVNGILLFLGSGPVGPNPMVELYDKSGVLLSRHEP